MSSYEEYILHRDRWQKVLERLNETQLRDFQGMLFKELEKKQDMSIVEAPKYLKEEMALSKLDAIRAYKNRTGVNLTVAVGRYRHDKICFMSEEL